MKRELAKKGISVWVIGGGRFGRKAVTTLHRLNPWASVTVVDRDIGVCSGLQRLPVDVVCADGIDFLSACLEEGGEPDWIVPVIPEHVAYEWVRRRLPPEFRIEPLPIPDVVMPQVPNPVHGPTGALYVSLADFVCPENCPEPSEICTHTGKPRPFRLFEKLSRLHFETYRAIVLRSVQLSPGVGGYKPSALFEALALAVSETGPVMLSTACSCHGVMHAFAVVPENR